MTILFYLLSRLAEPSSYAGLAAVTAGVHSIGSGNLAAGAGELLGGLVAFALPEGTAPGPVQLKTQ